MWRLTNAFTQCDLRPTSEMARQRLIVTPNAICDGVAPFSTAQQGPRKRQPNCRAGH